MKKKGIIIGVIIGVVIIAVIGTLLLLNKKDKCVYYDVVESKTK